MSISKILKLNLKIPITTLEVLIILGVCSVIFLIGFTPNLGRTLLSIDSVVSKERPIQFLDDYQASWWPASMGYPSTFHPFSLYQYALALIFPIWIWQRVVLFLPLLIASLTMYFFLKETQIAQSSWGRVLGAMFYGVNWVTLGGNWNEINSMAGSAGMLQVYAWSPLFLLGLYKVLLNNSPGFINAIGMAFAMAMGSLALAIQTPVYQIMASLPVIIYAVIVCPRWVVRRIPWIILSALVFGIFSLDWFLIYLAPMFSLNVQNVTSIVHGSTLKFLVDASWYKRVYPLSMSPLMFFKSEPAQFGFSSLFVLFIMLVPLLTHRPSRRFILYACHCCCAFLVLAFLMLYKENSMISSILFDNVFMLQGFTEPLKWYFLLVPWAVVMFVMGIEHILVVLHQPTFSRVFPLKGLELFLGKYISARDFQIGRYITRGFLICLLVFCFLVWGELTLNTRASWLNDNFGAEEIFAWPPVLSPTEFDEMIRYLDHLNNHEDSFRILLLPSTHFGLMRLGGTDSMFQLMPARDPLLTQLLDTTITQMRLARTSPSFSQAMRVLSARYVVVVKRSEGPCIQGEPRIAYGGGKAQWICGQPHYFEQFMASQGDWQILREMPGYTIYQIK